MDDIEALKQELKATRLACEMVSHTGQFKAGFLARTAHELRSPLSRLMGLHQIILSDLCESPQEEREFLQQAYQSAQQLMEFLDDLIAVSKIESGTSKLEIYPLQLAEVLEELERLTYLQAANQHLSLQVLLPEPEIYILADRKRLLQVLVSLVDMAISSMDKGSIRVSTQAGEKLASVDIDIDIKYPPSFGSEPVDLMQKLSETVPAEVMSHPLQMSPGMKFSLAQNLLEVMGGSLEMLQLSRPNILETLTRLRCWLPIC